MQRRDSVSMQLSLKAIDRLRVIEHRRPLLLMAISGTLVLFTLACVSIGPTSPERIAIRTRLPTLTRTPLPTLTPTAFSTPLAVAMPAEPAITAPAPVPSPITPVDSPAEATPAQLSNLPGTEVAGPPPMPAEPVAVNSAVPPTSPPTPTATATPLPTSTPTATATDIPTPTPVPPTSTPLPEGWVFSGVRASTDHDRGILILYGDLINNTGMAQDLAFMTGTFYDDQGQVMPDRPKFVSWPTEIIAQGGRVPFELTVMDMDRADNFDLRVEARPGDEIPREDFEFLDPNPSTETGNYCVVGRLRNPGGVLQDHLRIVAVLFDDQDKVLNFNDYYKHYPQEVVGDQTMDFEVCIDSFNQEVARYELRAWGL